MSKEEYLSKISNLYNYEFVDAFPYGDTERIKNDFVREFNLLKDESLNADFNDYCTLIIGTTSYILKGNADNIPKQQNKLLKRSFFERFSQYAFIEVSLSRYPSFKKKYVHHEQLRKLVLDYLHQN